MVQPLPGFLHLCLDVCSPCQVLGDVYTEVLETAHPLHRGPADHKRSVGPQEYPVPDVLSEQHICTLYFSSTGTACTRTVMSAARMNQCFVLLSEHSMCNDAQSRRADIIYGSQTEQAGCDE